MPLYDVKTTEFVVVLRSEIIGTNRLILAWIGSCPGSRNGSALARKARGPGSIPGPGGIFLFQISQLANRWHSSENQMLNFLIIIKKMFLFI